MTHAGGWHCQRGDTTHAGGWHCQLGDMTHARSLVCHSDYKKKIGIVQGEGSRLSASLLPIIHDALCKWDLL